MANTNPTIYDVARVAGVSIATVSRVLNSNQKVNPQTRSAVLDAIDRLGFVPKAESRARALMSTGRIGVLIPFFTAPSFVQRLRGIASALSKENFELVIYPVDTHSRMVNYLETLPLNRNLDGLIIVSIVFGETVARRLKENHLETVVIEYFDQNFCSLQIDDEAGGYLAAQHLVKKGYQNFAFFGGIDIPVFGVDPIRSRLAGFRRGLSEIDYHLPDDMVHVLLPKPGEALKRAVSKSKLPLAIFVATDLQAFAVMKEARSMGLRIPQDIAIIGFDDLDIAEYVGLTTIRQPLDESGKVATELLLSRLNDPSRSVQHIKLPLKVVERETV